MIIAIHIKAKGQECWIVLDSNEKKWKGIFEEFIDQTLMFVSLMDAFKRNFWESFFDDPFLLAINQVLKIFLLKV